MVERFNLLLRFDALAVALIFVCIQWKSENIFLHADAFSSFRSSLGVPTSRCRFCPWKLSTARAPTVIGTGGLSTISTCRSAQCKSTNRCQTSVLFGTGEPYVEDDSIDLDPTLVLEGELGPVDLEEIDTAKLKTFQSDISNVAIKRDLSGDYFGPLLPIAERIDSATGGWGLSYADLHPETPQTPLGVAFLATNACYAFGGLVLGVQGEWTLGLLTEVAGIVSFWYHYSQLNFGQDRKEVRLALLIDYFTAGTALLCGAVYMAQMGIDSVPLESLLWGGASVVCLTLCWVKEVGYWYLFWHSLWHIGSAYTGYLVGQNHINNGMIS